jgi:antitoxin component of MazEF toxin-antitoxin module
MEIRVEKKWGILEPAQKKEKLKALLSKVTSENIYDEIETGNGVGNEVW